MPAGRPKIGYVGNKYGLVTVVQRFGNIKMLCQCECGAVRYVTASNLIRHPPKTHRACMPFLQYELPLERVCK